MEVSGDLDQWQSGEGYLLEVETNAAPQAGFEETLIRAASEEDAVTRLFLCLVIEME